MKIGALHNQFSKIIGTGSYLPEKIIMNEQLSKNLDTSHAWIVERTGIHQRHIAAPHQLTSDLGLLAAERALAAAQLDIKAVDCLLLATTTPDQTFPAAATRLQEKLGMSQGFAFDIGAACSGFIFALATADTFIRQGMCHTALVVGSETMSRLIDWSDRRTAVLFGDGAGAVVLQASPLPGILSNLLASNGEGGQALYVSGGPSSSQEVGKIHMQGQDVFKEAVRHMTQTIEKILEQNQLEATDIDWLVPHQANRRIIDMVAQRLGWPQEKIIHTGSLHANTSAASIPLALDTAVQEGKIKPGHLVLCEAFGAGFTWGASLIRF